MIAQRGAFIVAAEQAATLQFRDYEIDEFVERAREMRRQHVEPVGGAFDKPLLEGVGDGLRSAADHPVAARRRGQIVEVAQGHVLALSHLIEDAVERAATLRRWRRGWRRVEVMAG